MMGLRATRWLLAVLLVPLLFAGCGYSSGFVLPDGRFTVGVEYFGNNSPVRDLEAELNDYLTDSVQRMVHARLVPPEEADYVIRGTVVTFARRRGIRSPENVRLETGVRIAAQAELWERGRPEEGGDLTRLYDQRFSSESGFRLEEPMGEDQARDRVLRNLADEVVIELFGFLAAREGP